MTPGATTAVVVRNTLARGARGGVTAAAGAATANAIQAAIAGAGVALLIARSPHALTALRIAGAAYLGWLGMLSARRGLARNASRMNFRGSDSGENSSGKNFGSFSRSYRQGLATNLLHPGVTTFYVAVLPAFIPADAPRGYFAFLALIHIVIAFACHTAWTVAFDRLRRAMERPAVARALELATAGVLIFLAVKILLD